MLIDIKFNFIKAEISKTRQFRPKGGENNIDVFIRAKRLLYHLIDKYAKSNFYESLNLFIEKKMTTILETQIESIQDQMRSQYKDKSEQEIKELIEKQIEEFKLSINNEKYLMKIYQNEILKNHDIFNENYIETPANNFFVIDQTEKEVDDFIFQYNNLSSNNKLKEINFNYDESEIDSFLESLNDKITDISNLQPYSIQDSKNETDVNRILIISHSGFISELLNIIRKLWNLKPNEKNVISHTAIFVIKIYCKYCGMSKKCENKLECNNDEKRIIEFDFILNNDTSHLSNLNI
jgi:hypothetical protein